jgi:uncharacterized RDD family membrane protein YckC
MTDYLSTEYKLARILDRCFGALIDYFIFCCLWFLDTYFLVEKIPIEKGGIAFYPNIWAVLGIIMAWFIIFPVIEYFNKGQTLGKWILRVKVISEDGLRPRFDQTLLRHLMDPFDNIPGFGLLGLIVASSNYNQQRIGDKAGKTIVVRSK